MACSMAWEIFYGKGLGTRLGDGRGRRLARSGIIHADSCDGKLFVWFMAHMAARGSLHFSGTA